MASPSWARPDVGLLILRVGVGAMMVYHGWPKVAGGAAGWERLGGAMGTFGIHFLPTMWGAAAAFSEFLGGILLALGLGTRIAAAFLSFTMVVAAVNHFAHGQGMEAAGHPLELLCVFVGLIFLGPGRYSVDGYRRP